MAQVQVVPGWVKPVHTLNSLSMEERWRNCGTPRDDPSMPHRDHPSTHTPPLSPRACGRRSGCRSRSHVALLLLLAAGGAHSTPTGACRGHHRGRHHRGWRHRGCMQGRGFRALTPGCASGGWCRRKDNRIAEQRYTAAAAADAV